MADNVLVNEINIMKSNLPLIICLMGPTASGKTDLAVKIVQQLPCEIISVDSAMVYRGMDIGTAKPTPDILKIAPHRLLDICDPAESYSAGQFRADAVREINDIIQHKRIPLLVGGTMLYFHALQRGLADLPQANPQIREQINQEAQLHSWQKLHERLQKIDPIAAQRIHPNDPQRLQRALEVYEITGKSLTTLLAEETKNKLPYHVINIAIATDDKKLLHNRIAERFNKMLQQGFIEEVEKLYRRGDLHPDLPSIRAVGYRQAWDYLDNKISFEEMQQCAIIATRQLAKRQMTWLKRWDNLQWLTSEDIDLDKIISSSQCFGGNC